MEISDQLQLPEFHEIFRTILGWDDDLGYIIRIHGQEFNSFCRKTRSKALHEFQLHRQEKFLYICDTLHLWQWDVRVLHIQEEMEEEHVATCGGPTGYRLMLKRKHYMNTIDGRAMRSTGLGKETGQP